MPKKPNKAFVCDPSIVYTSGASVYDGKRLDFSSCTKEEQDEHSKELWRACFLKAMGSSNLKRIFEKLNQKLLTFGTTRNINRTRQDIEKKILQHKPWIVIMPDDTIKKFWNILMIFLLAYVATYVPYSICFIEPVPDAPMTTGEMIDIMVDILFLCDIFINFASSYENSVTNLPIINLKSIAINYLTGWFFLDLIAVIPVQLFE